MTRRHKVPSSELEANGSYILSIVFLVDPSFKKAWEVIRVALKESLTLPVFGYSGLFLQPSPEEQAEIVQTCAGKLGGSAGFVDVARDGPL
jgi:hypothetical protein